MKEPGITELGSAEFWERIKNEPAKLAAELCFIDLTQLDVALQKHPSLHAWVNAEHEVARIAESRADWELIKARARALLVAKATPDTHTNKMKTVDVLDAEADTHESVQNAKLLLFDAQEKRGALRAIMDAMEGRIQMLVQIAAKQRQEANNYSRS